MQNNSLGTPLPATGATNHNAASRGPFASALRNLAKQADTKDDDTTTVNTSVANTNQGRDSRSMDSRSVPTSEASRNDDRKKKADASPQPPEKVRKLFRIL